MGISNTVAGTPLNRLGFLLGTLLQQILRDLLQHRRGLRLVPRDVHQDDRRMLVRVIARLCHRQTQLAAVDVRQIVEREPQTDARLC